MAEPRPSQTRPPTGPASMSGWPAPACSPLASGAPQGNLSPFASGFPLGTPSPFASGWQSADVFFIGCEVDQSAAMAFQLAPRMFVVARAMAGEPADVAFEPGGPLDHLPPHLAFLECSSGDRRGEQHWVSDDVGAWKWNLVVRHDCEAVEVILSAVRASDGGEWRQYVWKAANAWDPFGVNFLEPHHSGAHAAPLTVAAS